MKSNEPKSKPSKAALLGIGLDNEDGHTRITRGGNFFLYGGSADTHATMQETIIKVTERLDERGRRLEDVSPRELRDLFEDVTG